uniref:Uncharacterized protein n=1 Tax=Arundo donax TaxID=35708 RepID=A0A0A9HNB6_ARUDO
MVRLSPFLLQREALLPEQDRGMEEALLAATRDVKQAPPRRTYVALSGFVVLQHSAAADAHNSIMLAASKRMVTLVSAVEKEGEEILQYIC